MSGSLLSSNVPLILGAIKSTGVPGGKSGSTVARATQPFVTISREAGAGGVTLGKALVDRLNAVPRRAAPELPGDEDRAWEALDRELIERIAADHHISSELIASLEETSHNWLTDFFGGLSLRDDATPSEVRVFHSVAATVRALAQAGRVVMVGCGAGLIAGNMAGGVHVRLVADLPYRIRYMARLLGVDERAAAAEVRRRDANRQAFYRRFFPGTPLTPERFTMVLNSAVMGEEQMVAAILAVLTTRTERHGS